MFSSLGESNLLDTFRSVSKVTLLSKRAKESKQMDKHSANLKTSDRVHEASDSSTRPSFTALRQNTRPGRVEGWRRRTPLLLGREHLDEVATEDAELDS